MQTLLLVLVMSGLVALRSAWSQAVHTGRCSYAGVVHLEGSSQYSLTYQQAIQLCQSLGYRLATEEQLTKAYNQGLKTCRYGWIEGQKTSFLPNDVDLHCPLNSTEITSHVEKEDNLYDVYCFTQSDSLEVSCEDAATPTPASVNNQSMHPELTTTTAKPEEDVFEEVIADGFIVDMKGTTTSAINEKSEATTPNSLIPDGNATPSPQEETITTITVAKDLEVTTEESESDGGSNTEEPEDENAKNSPTTIPDQDSNSEGTTVNMVSTGVTKHHTTVKLTTEESINESESTNTEGSGMFPETFTEKNPKDLIIPTSVTTPVGDLLSSNRLLVINTAVEGSGMEFKEIFSIKSTTKGTPKPLSTVGGKAPEEYEEKLIEVKFAKPVNAEVPNQNKRLINIAEEPQPTTSALAEEGTPGWLIIFAFCMTLGAILCIFAGIATKDKWYGPSRRSANTTLADNDAEYGKAATLPLSMKEQELMTLMNGVEKNDKDFTAIPLNEAPEKEFLM